MNNIHLGDEHLPNLLKTSLGAVWPWSVIIYVVAFVAGVEIAIFGYSLVVGF